MMKMKCATPDAGLLSVRLGLAAVFIVHGAMKLATVAATMAIFEKMGLPGWLGAQGDLEIRTVRSLQRSAWHGPDLENTQ